MLEAEEGDRPLGEVPVRATGGGSGSLSMVWKWLQSWVYTAAVKAPSRTEALLHQFLGRTSINAVPAPLATARFSGAFAKAGGAAAAANIEGNASAAALRRASELLAICSEPRRRGATGSGSDAKALPGSISGGTSLQDGTLALCRKQYFAGMISGMQNAQADPEDASTLAAQLAEALEVSIRNHHSLPVIEERYLAAAALLATSPAAEVGSARCFGLLSSMALVPVSRFTPEAVSLAVFAWTWVSAAAPAWLVPLTSRVVSAWCWSVDQKLGLFSKAASGTGGGDMSSSSGSPSTFKTLDGIRSHGLWLQYFTELWGSLSDGPETPALHRLFGRMLIHSLSDPAGLCGHPAAAAARFQLLSLALKYCRKIVAALPALAAANPPVPLILLHDRVLKAAIMW